MLSDTDFCVDSRSSSIRLLLSSSCSYIREGKLRSLPVIEKETQELWEGEVVVNISNDMIENLRRVFMASKKRDEEHLEDVICEDFLYDICDDPYLEKKLDVIVRETTD